MWFELTVESPKSFCIPILMHFQLGSPSRYEILIKRRLKRKIFHSSYKKVEIFMPKATQSGGIDILEPKQRNHFVVLAIPKHNVRRSGLSTVLENIEKSISSILEFKLH